MPEKQGRDITRGDILVDEDGELWEVMGTHPTENEIILWVWSDHTSIPCHFHKIRPDQPLNTLNRPQWVKERDAGE